MGLAQLSAKLDELPGLIPIAIDLDERKLVWRDLGCYHPYEGFFRNTVSAAHALRLLRQPGATAEVFETRVEVLMNDGIVRDFVPPTGFIFHLGRCGSTLLAKALARSRSNLVFGEANPHQHIWPYLAGNRPPGVEPSRDNLELYRRLVLAMGRRRVATHRCHFCKFTSFDTLFLGFILSAFPDTPAICLYRDPREVLVSYLEKKGGWLAYQGSAWGDFIAGRDDLGIADELTYVSEVIGHCLNRVLQAGAPNLKYLSYGQLGAANLPSILASFGAEYPQAEVTLMKEQFAWYSKSEFCALPFESDRERQRRVPTREIRTIVEERLAPLYRHLQDSPRNILPTY